MDKARTFNLSKTIVDNAIKSGLASKDEALLERINYEGYGPAGVAFIIDSMTDKRTRTASTLRKLFQDHSGSLGGNGQVSWIFELKGIINIAKVALESKEDQVMELCGELGAQDIDVDKEGNMIISCEPSQTFQIKDELEKKLGLQCSSCEMIMFPKNTVSLALDSEDALAVQAFVDALDAHDDVQNVYHNAKFA